MISCLTNGQGVEPGQLADAAHGTSLLRRYTSIKLGKSIRVMLKTVIDVVRFVNWSKKRPNKSYKIYLVVT